MEGVILGWFVLVSTGSVLALAVFGSLQFLGTLISPVFGMVGDRIGNRNLLCLMRATYLAVATALAALFLAGLAAPVPVFALATIMGLVRPSDITLRNLLVGETMPASYLMRAMGVSRTTADSARVVGALSGAGLVAALGSGVAYVVVCVVYAASLALTFNVGIRRLRVVGEAPTQLSPMRALRQGFAYVWSTPDMRALMLLAFLMNFAAYPLVGSLLAYVAKDIYGLDQTGLGWLIACFAGGALAGLDRHLDPRRAHPAGPHHAGRRRRVVHPQSRVLLDQRPAAGRDRPVRRGLRPELLHDSHGGAAAARRRSAFSRPGHGRAHAGGLRHADRPFAVGPLVERVGFAVTGSLFSLVGIVFTGRDRALLARAISGIRPRTPTSARGNLGSPGCVTGRCREHRQGRHPGADDARWRALVAAAGGPTTRRRRPRPPRTRAQHLHLPGRERRLQPVQPDRPRLHQRRSHRLAVAGHHRHAVRLGGADHRADFLRRGRRRIRWSAASACRSARTSTRPTTSSRRSPSTTTGPTRRGSMPASLLQYTYKRHDAKTGQDEPVRLDTLQVDLGVIGPAAGGEFVQNNFHRLIGVARANGWANQLHNEPTIGSGFRAALAHWPHGGVRRSQARVRLHPAHRRQRWATSRSMAISAARRASARTCATISDRPRAAAVAARLGGLHRRRQLRLVPVRRHRRPGGRPKHLPRRQYRRQQPAGIASSVRRRGPGGPGAHLSRRALHLYAGAAHAGFL